MGNAGLIFHSIWKNEVKKVILLSSNTTEMGNARLIFHSTCKNEVNNKILLSTKDVGNAGLSFHSTQKNEVKKEILLSFSTTEMGNAEMQGWDRFIPGSCAPWQNQSIPMSFSTRLIPFYHGIIIMGLLNCPLLGKTKEGKGGRSSSMLFPSTWKNEVYKGIFLSSSTTDMRSARLIFHSIWKNGS